jgi:DNA-binding beta-propeller fold protein YncE
VPAPKGNFSYDIGWVDSDAHRYYVADRTNKGIDVIDTTNKTFLTTLAAGKFEGFTGNPDASGPDGVLLIPEDHQLWVGDAHSLVKVVDVASGSGGGHHLDRGRESRR